MLIRTRQDHPRVRLETPEGEGRTHQSMKDECDINRILAKFEKTGQLPGHLNQGKPSYGDFSNVDDYHASVNQVMAAEDAFMQLPVGVRNFFHNSPGNLIEFLDNPENDEKARELGLLPPAAVPAAVPPETTTPVEPEETPA